MFAAFTERAAAHLRASATGCIDMASIRRRHARSAASFVSFSANHANRSRTSEASALHRGGKSLLRVTGSLVGSWRSPRLSLSCRMFPCRLISIVATSVGRSSNQEIAISPNIFLVSEIRA
jgi:hypothetical protein